MIRTVIDTIKAYLKLLSVELYVLFSFKIKSNSTDENHLLLIAQSLPPHSSSGVFRPLSWLQYAEVNNWKTSVLTREYKLPLTSSGEFLKAQLPQHIPFKFIKKTSLKPSWKVFPRIHGHLLDAIETVPVGSLFFTKKNPPSTIVATGPEFDTFIMAYYLSRLFKAKLVLDYRDEWTLSAYKSEELGNTDTFWERRCLRVADCIIFTTHSMQKIYIEKFPELLSNKSCVVHNGWEDGQFQNNDEYPLAKLKKDELIIQFAGKMSKAARPAGFLKDFENVLRQQPELRELVNFHIVGTRDRVSQQSLDGFAFKANITIMGQVPKDVANRMIRMADIQLLIHPKEVANRLPLKLFEYLASGKPVIIHGIKGETSDIVTKLEAGYFVEENDPDALGRALQEIASSPPTRWQNDKRRRWVEAHTRENLAKEFFGILENL